MKFEIVIEIEADDMDEAEVFYNLLWNSFISKELTDKYKIKGTHMKAL